MAVTHQPMFHQRILKAGVHPQIVTFDKVCYRTIKNAQEEVFIYLIFYYFINDEGTFITFLIVPNEWIFNLTHKF